MADRLPPHDIEAEECVLGSCLIDGEAITKVTLSPAEFYSMRNKYIYEAIVAVHNKGIPVNQITVADKLVAMDRLEAAGGAAMLSHVIGVTPTSLDVEAYAAVVSQKYFFRQAIAASDQSSTLAYLANLDPAVAMDRIDRLWEAQRRLLSLTPRRLEVTRPRLIKTDPPGYIWNVNGTDINLTSDAITVPGKFKAFITTKLNFVPIMPKDWDEFVNTMLTTSVLIDAPKDASDEYQLKVLVQKWIGTRQETNVVEDLSNGYHLMRELNGISYVCFRSTPLLDFLKRQMNKVFKSGNLWSSHVSKWGGIQHQWRCKTASGGNTVASGLWCLPIDFINQIEDTKQSKPTSLPPSTQPPDNKPIDLDGF